MRERGSGKPGPDPGHPQASDDQEFEALLARALRVDVPPERRAEVRRPYRTVRWMAIAAGVLLALGVTMRALQDAGYLSTGDLSQDVVAHIHHEADAIRQPIVSEAAAEDPVQVGRVLQAAGAEMQTIRPMVRYARLCPFRGEMVAHFVVQGGNGPVTVLLLPDEQVDGRRPIEENGFVGTIVPLQIGGSIAVVGEPGEAELSEIEREVAAAVRWRL